MALLDAEGPEGTKSIFCHVAPGHPNYPEGLADNSHLQLRGAVRIAALFLREDECPSFPSERPVFSEPASAGLFPELIRLEDRIL